MRKAWVIVVALLLIVVGGAAYAWHWYAPMLALREIRIAMSERDPVKLDPLVDWATLRASVEHDAKEKIHDKNDGKFLEFLRNWVGDEIAEDRVAIAATPRGLIRLTCDKKPDGDFDATAQQPCPIDSRVLDYGYHQNENGRFDAIVEDGDGKTMRFIMARNPAGRWQLIHMQNVSEAPK